MHLTRDPNRRIAGGLFLLLASIYALTAGGHTSSPDEEGILAQARAIASGTSTLAVDATNESVTSRRILDDGRAAGASNLGPSVAALPLLGVGSLAGRATPPEKRVVVENLMALFTNSIVTASTGVVLFFLAMRLGAPRRRAALLALVFGLGTYAWPHARTLFSEPLTALFLIGAVLAAIAAVDEGSWRRAALAGACAGLALNVRTSAAIFPVLVGLFVAVGFLRRRGAIPSVIGATAFGIPVLAGFGLLLASNAWRYGSPTDLGPPSVPFNFPLSEGLVNLYFSSGKSLFLYVPVLLVAVVALPVAVRKRPWETGLLIGLIAMNSILFARFVAWHGDQAWGPRYLQIIVPCAVVLVAPALGANLRWARAVAVAGVFGAIGPAAMGVLIYPNAYFQVGNAEPTLTGRVEANGERRYINAFHFDPYWSPILGHARMLPRAVAKTTERLDGRPPEVGVLPTKPNDRYFWWDFLEEVDIWWLWLPSAQLPQWLWLMVPLFGTGAGVGVIVLRAGLKGPGSREPIPDSVMMFG